VKKAWDAEAIALRRWHPDCIRTAQAARPTGLPSGVRRKAQRDPTEMRLLLLIDRPHGWSDRLERATLAVVKEWELFALQIRS